MTSNLTEHSIVVATRDQVSCPLGEESAILGLKTSIYYGLDRVGSRVWSLLQVPRTVGQLRDSLLEEYEVEPARCQADLLDLLANLHREGLIEIRDSSLD